MCADAIIDDPVYSVLTFALFEDTGWYKVDWDWAAPLNFGRNRGCEFHTETCIDLNQAARFPEFCTDTSGLKQCDYNNLHVGNCNLQTFASARVPSEFQWFGDDRTGGKDALADYCPVIGIHANRSCRGTTVTYPSEIVGETIGVKSRCVEGSLAPVGSTPTETAFCLDVTSCNPEVGVTVRLAPVSGDIPIDEVTVECSFDGSQISVPGYDGFLNCPSSSTFCRPIVCAFN
jgi:hypothetical protein